MYIFTTRLQVEDSLGTVNFTIYGKNKNMRQSGHYHLHLHSQCRYLSYVQPRDETAWALTVAWILGFNKLTLDSLSTVMAM